LGDGETIFLPNAACDKYINDAAIQAALTKVHNKINSMIDSGASFSFVESLTLYVRSIFAFGKGVDRFYVKCQVSDDGCCKNANCTIRINRRDYYTDPQDKHEGSGIGKSAFSPEANEYGTPYAFGISCNLPYQARKCN
jgi:hypothetical protein